MSLTPLPAFKDLVPKAESFEIFQKSLGSSSPVSSVAFTAPKSRRSCGSYNGGHGHGRGKRGSYTPRCQICKTEGHTVDRCWSRYEQSDWFTDTDASAT
ncbi:hypothetical protein AAG906_025482 [Vitis piasezkii]